MFTAFFKALSPAKKIAFLALFCSLSVLVNLDGVLAINLGGTNKITFTYAVCFFCAVMLGALPSALIAFLGDSIGYLLTPQGPYWFYGVTLALFAMLCGAVFHYLPVKGKKSDYIKAAVALFVGYLLVTVLLNTLVNYYYVKLFIWKGEVKKTLWVYLGGRIGIQTLVYAVNVALCMIALPLMRAVMTGMQGRGHTHVQKTAPQN